jgi:dTDP-4-dehydrorhamnose reductase
MDSVLSSGKETDFFEDEFRNPVYVGDVVAAISKLVESADHGEPRIDFFHCHVMFHFWNIALSGIGKSVATGSGNYQYYGS